MRIKLIIMLVLAISAVIVVGYISYHGLNILMDTIEENLEPDSRESDLESLLHQISEAESNLRIYAITEESKYLRPYYENVEKADSLLKVLQNKSRDENVITWHLDTMDQILHRKISIQTRLIRLKQEQERIDVYEEVLYQFQYLEKKNAMIDSLKNAIARAEQTLEKEILEKEKEISGLEDEDDFTDIARDQVRKGFFRRLFKSGKKTEPELLKPEPNTSLKVKSLDSLLAIKDTLSYIADTLYIENITSEIERTLAEVRIRQDNLNMELALIELNLTRRDRAYGFQIQQQAALISKYFTELDAEQAKEASNFFHEITNQITLAGSVFSMLFIILVFIVMNDIQVNLKYRRALETAKNNAESLARAKEDFLSNMSHEIRTPLNAIIGFAEQMNHSALNTENRAQLLIIQNASKHLLAIINDILDYSKMEAGKIHLDAVPFSVEEHTRIVYDTLQKSASDKQLEFHLHLGEKTRGLFTMGDPVRYRQILFNLAGNAIKFTENGFVKISVDMEDMDIVIKVTDTGIGIDKDHLDIIFEKFDQASTADSYKYGGTGLGLTIVKKLVELQGGDVMVASEKNHGTEFIVKLPCTQPDLEFAEISNNFAINDYAVPENLKVLIVDDEAFNVKLIETMLDKYHISHQSASSGKQALELFADGSFDIILMDLRMHDLDGFETTKILRNEYKTDIPIVAVTATATGDIRENCLKAGMNEVLIKPISEHGLLSCLKISQQREASSPTTVKDRNSMTNESVENETNRIDMKTLLSLFQNDKVVAADMTRLYHTSLVSFEINLKENITKEDYMAIQRDVHKIIPSSRHMGFTGFAEQLKVIELTLMNDPGTSELSQLHKIHSDTIGIVIALEKFLEEIKG